MNYLLLVSVVFSTSALANSNFQSKIDEIYKRQAPKIEKCEQFNKMKNASFKQLDEVVRKEEASELVITEAEARKLLLNYESSNDYFEAQEEYNDLILNECTAENLSLFNKFFQSKNLCLFAMDDMTFFNSMIFASANQSWKKENKDLLVKVAMGSIKNHTNKNTPVLMYLTGLTIIGHMIDYNLLDKKLDKEVRELKGYAEGEFRKIYPTGTHRTEGNCVKVLKQIKSDNKLKVELFKRMSKLLR